MITQSFKREKTVTAEKQDLHVKMIFPTRKSGGRGAGGALINGFNTQSHASKVQRVGASRDDLHGAAAIELCSHPLCREAKLARCQFESDGELERLDRGAFRL